MLLAYLQTHGEVLAMAALWIGIAAVAVGCAIIDARR